MGTAASARRSRDSEHSTHRRHGEKDEIHATAGPSSGAKNKDVDSDPWLEVGCVSFGPIIVESASALPIPEHCLHLVQHK